MSSEAARFSSGRESSSEFDENSDDDENSNDDVVDGWERLVSIDCLSGRKL
jgi:hypothetical protein